MEKNAPPMAAWIWMNSGAMPPTARSVLAIAGDQRREPGRPRRPRPAPRTSSRRRSPPPHVQHVLGEQVEHHELHAAEDEDAQHLAAHDRLARRAGDASMRAIVCWARSAIVENAPNIAPNIRNIAVIDRL